MDEPPYISVYVCLGCGQELTVGFYDPQERDAFVLDDFEVSECCGSAFLHRGFFNLEAYETD